MPEILYRKVEDYFYKISTIVAKTGAIGGIGLLTIGTFMESNGLSVLGGISTCISTGYLLGTGVQREQFERVPQLERPLEKLPESIRYSERSPREIEIIS